MEIIDIADPNLNKTAAAVLAAGGLIIFPTETSYGAGVDALNPAAVEKLLTYKNRPVGKAISVAVADTSSAYKLIKRNEQTDNIFGKFLPGPITVIGASRGKVDKRLESQLGTLGIRIPAYEPILELLRESGIALTATSANVSGGNSPYNAQQLLAELPAKKKALIDLVIDAGELEHNPPSLVVDTTQTNKVFRPGLISPRDLALGEVFESNSVFDTKRIAADFIARVSHGDQTSIVCLLQGELGAGKTQFSAGVGEALGVREVINSPSFNIANEYSFQGNLGTGTFHHLDLWRLEEVSALADFDIDLESATGERLVVCVEWPDLLAEADKAPKPGLQVFSVKILSQNAEQRRIIITPEIQQ